MPIYFADSLLPKDPPGIRIENVATAIRQHYQGV